MTPGPQPPTSEKEREFQKSREVADYYFKKRNWQAAESRYRDALHAKPGEPETVFYYAETLRHLGRPVEAREAYSEYLSDQPDGPHAKQCRAALERGK